MDQTATAALAIVGIFPAVAVLVAVFAQSKTIAAFAQLGGLRAPRRARTPGLKTAETALLLTRRARTPDQRAGSQAGLVLLLTRVNLALDRGSRGSAGGV